MYIIPQSFIEGKTRLHVTAENAEEVYKMLCDAGMEVYYDFIRFVKRWSVDDNFVTCYNCYDSDSPCNYRVHIQGKDVRSDSVFELEDWITVDFDTDEFLTLL